MMQRLCAQLSLKRSRSLTVSTLALTIGLVVFEIEKPQTIGNTASLPDLEGAITGTISVGLISPSILSGRESAMVMGLAREDFAALSIYGWISVDFLIKNRPHMVMAFYHPGMDLLSG